MPVHERIPCMHAPQFQRASRALIRFFHSSLVSRERTCWLTWWLSTYAWPLLAASMLLFLKYELHCTALPYTTPLCLHACPTQDARHCTQFSPVLAGCGAALGVHFAASLRQVK